MAKLKKQIKKKFFPVEIPVLNKEIELYSKTQEELNEKVIKLDLAPELRGKSLNVKFLVSVDNKKATASPIEAKLLSTYTRRMARKGTDYSEDSFSLNCKDKIQIKNLIITRKQVTRKVLNGLRIKAKEEITKWAKEKTFESLISEIISGQIQKELLVTLKKIYPLSACEIKFIGIKKQGFEEKIKKEENDTTNTSSN
ncbi:MAG: hypothetical protein U9Q06_01390 [Nanoarchaeota archaeon]|nr:hypothetical protein [Nanoarchaeota archaeon]